MTQPSPAVGGEPTAPAADASDPFMELASEMLPEQDEEEEQPAEEVDGEQPETSEEADDEPEIEAEDDDLPPIDAPVSWDAEAKAKFAELPRDVQEYLSKREGERERFVQQKSQEAARARQEVEQTALQQLAQYDRQVSEQLSQYAEAIGPQRPNPALLQHDPQAFYAQQYAYETATAQQRELQQQAAQYAQQAQAREAQAEQAFHAEQRQRLVESFPEYLDPTTGPQLQAELSTVARELGYSPELIAQARADDILAMKTAADWKAKASKYDALMAKKMEKVRAAKGLPKVATPGVPQGAQQLRQGRADAAWQAAKSAKTRNARDAHLANWAESAGWLD